MPTQYEISLNPTSAKGDILSFDGSSRSRIPAGSNGQILTARSSASSGIQFETITAATADFVLISSSILTANSATVVFSSIPSSYRSLKVICFASGNTTGGAIPLIRVNSVTSGYAFSAYERSTTAYQVNTSTSATSFQTAAYDGNIGNGIILEVNIYGANNSSANVLFSSMHAMVNSNANTRRHGMSSGRVSASAVVSSVTFLLQSTDVYGSGSEFALYGRV